MKNNIYFFIGTEAELIKVFPVIIECQKRNMHCHIIASGQNDLNKSRILQYVVLNGKYLELSKEEDIKKSAVGLLTWFVKTRLGAVKKIKKEFTSDELKDSAFVVHGDTVSTFMGAMIGKKLGCKVCHVEAGLRSHDLFNPFPEEIDRLLTSRLARIHFAPGKEAATNLSKVKGQVVDTEFNTILDSLRFSKEIPLISEKIDELQDKDYFVFVMHRQENLMNKEFVGSVIDKIKVLSKKCKCVLILHKITENTLKDMKLLDELKQDKQFVLLPRVDYFDFMKLLGNAQYVITDGGSNQEELHYMGKPCLIMRKTTERQEGIGENATLFGGDVKEILVFADRYQEYAGVSIASDKSPSAVIADCLEKKVRKWG